MRGDLFGAFSEGNLMHWTQNGNSQFSHCVSPSTHIPSTSAHPLVTYTVENSDIIADLPRPALWVLPYQAASISEQSVVAAD